MKHYTTVPARLLLAGGAVVFSVAPAAAKDVYLVAAPFMLQLQGDAIPMWGYAEVGEAEFADLAAQLQTDPGAAVPPGLQPQAPGPVIAVDPADPRLDIHLLNWLDVPTSLMIPGQAMPVAKAAGEAVGNAVDRVWVDGAAVTTASARPSAAARIRSMTRETAPGGTMTYSWPDLRPGAYLYRTGTHLAVQVQMGLSGAVKKGAGANEPYSGVAAAGEIDLVYSEIDPALHQAVAGGTYGTSTLAYHPTWHLINGVAFDPDQPSASEYAVTSGSPVLLRFYNAGLRSHQPVLLGHDVEIVAEDGNPYPYRQRRYAVQLEAGKTKDAVFTAPAEGQYTVYDYMRDATPSGSGGMTAQLTAGPGVSLLAVDDAFSATEDTALTSAAPGVRGNDSGGGATTQAQLVGIPVGGSVALGADGGFTFTPAANFNGAASFTYQLVEGLSSSNVASVAISVAPVNDAPQAAPESYTAFVGEILTVAAAGGVLKNDADVDGTPLTAQLVSPPQKAASFALNANGSFSYRSVAGASGSDQFTYRAYDGTAYSAPAAVTIALQSSVNAPPVAVNDSVIILRDTTTTIAVLANDRDSDGTLVPSSVTITRRAKGATTANPDGTVTYTPPRLFTGTDTFNYTVRDNRGAVSKAATVKVNVVRTLAQAK